MGKIEIIIAEKPSSAKKIAYALADGKVKILKDRKLKYYQIKRRDKKIYVVGAAGHLFGVGEKNKSGFLKYPIFDVEWKPLYSLQKKASYTKDYIKLIKKLCEKADDVIIATDYDIEGEAIGYNILRFLARKEKAKRMLFSALTKKDIVEAYENSKEDILRGLANAGITRHILDFYWGINVSRALMNSIRKAGMFKILSSGRVQGPALKIIYDREREIENFVPKPYWKIHVKAKNTWFSHEKGKIWDNEEAKSIVKKVKDAKIGIVNDIQKKLVRQNPYPPFNLNDLQSEAYSLFKITPKRTQEIAQKLYELSLISYPRTSSQKLPKTIDFARIINNLSKIYSKEADIIMKKNELIPFEGKKTDEAHPAIHPTGETEELGKLKKDEKMIYDLIARRFLACFSEPCIKEIMKVILSIQNEKFLAEGKRIIKLGWKEIYPYSKEKEININEFTIGEKIKVEDVKKEKKETKPPERYNPASLIRELERRNLGTKSTRAEIIQNLYDRGYIKGRRIEITLLGKKIVEALEKNSPDLLSEELTREFEKKMEEIKKNKVKNEVVLEEAKKTLQSICEIFKEKESEIGKELIEAVRENEYLGPCKCGGKLIIKRSKSGKRFVGCNNFPKCKITYPLPGKGNIEATGKTCELCGTPIIKVKMKGKISWEMCLDPNCESKKNVKNNTLN